MPLLLRRFLLLLMLRAAAAYAMIMLDMPPLVDADDMLYAVAQQTSCCRHADYSATMILPLLI